MRVSVRVQDVRITDWAEGDTGLPLFSSAVNPELTLEKVHRRTTFHAFFFRPP